MCGFSFVVYTIRRVYQIQLLGVLPYTYTNIVTSLAVKDFSMINSMAFCCFFK